MNRDTFNSEIEPLWKLYREDNAWVGRWDPSWNRDEVMRDFMNAAFNLYQATSRNALKIVLLGGTGIRLNKELIANFGVTGVNGIQDDETAIHVAAEQLLRNAGTGRPAQSVSVTGVGSLLSEKKWTPLLNDSLIVGSATAGQEFQLTLEKGYHHDWRKCELGSKSEVRPDVAARHTGMQCSQLLKSIYENRVRFDKNYAHNEAAKIKYEEAKEDFLKVSSQFHHGVGEEFYKEVWKKFLNENLDMLWDNKVGIPRVLTRELIGVFLFGYKPEFKSMTLGFYKSRGAPQPKFADYVKLLRRLGMHGGKNARAVVLKHLSRCLFGDELALRFPEESFFKNVSSLKNQYLQNAKKR